MEEEASVKQATSEEPEDLSIVYDEVYREHVPFTQTDDEIVPIIVSRMNPFTPGHVILLTEALLYAANRNLHQVSIILSQSWDDDKNPVDPYTKQRLIYSVIPRLKKYLSVKFTHEGSNELAAAIQSIQVVIELMGDPLELLVVEEASEQEATAKPKARTSPALSTLQYILEHYYKYPRENLKVVVFCGEDRSYDFFGKSLGQLEPPVSFEGIKLKRPGMQSLIDMSTTDLIKLVQKGDVSPGAVSASLVRKTAKSGEEEVFSQLMDRTFLRPEDIKEVYDIIQDVPEEALKPGESKPNKRKGERGGTLKKNIKKSRKHKTRKYKSRKHKTRKNTKRNKK